MAEQRRFSAVFHLNDPVQRKAWEILSRAPPRQRMATLCRMICGYREQEQLLDALREVIREELKRVSVSGAAPQEIPQRALDFIQTL